MGLLLPLTLAKSKKASNRLSVSFETAGNNKSGDRALTIRFGPHELTASVALIEAGAKK